MKKRKKKPIKYSKARVVLSDTLPYEIPLTFSNRHFYSFINKFGISYISRYSDKHVKHYVTWTSKKYNEVVEQIIKLIFDLENLSTDNLIKITDNEACKIPFDFRISHKVTNFRELSVPHPKNQLELISFYDEYKELILNYSNQSPFSIRRPDSVAKFVFSNDNLHKINKGDESDSIEESGKEYESLKTFFTYSKYPNIYKFYEDYRYHRAEKKYNKLFQFDISRCFDSIYTHSIGWAVLSKDYIKDYLKPYQNNFGNRFDRFMQNANYGETNGILIGPEFSRIFAEIILQKIDNTVEKNLRSRDENKLVFKRDYEIFRYVDDYFVFYNEEKTKDDIFAEFNLLLKEYKMATSDSKINCYEKPLITELTIAKDKITDLIDDEIKFKIEEKEDNGDENEFEVISAKCNSKQLITKYKTIIKESEVAYKDVINYTFFLVNKKTEKCIEKFEKYYDALAKKQYEFSVDNSKPRFNNLSLQKKLKQEEKFNKFLVEILDFVFFIYTVNPRVTFTIKLCQILSKILITYKKSLRFLNTIQRVPGLKPVKIYSKSINRFLQESQEQLLKKISDEIILVLDKCKIHENIQIETLYLLIISVELGRNFKLTKDQIIKYFKISDDKGTCSFKYPVNYFAITVLLYYIKNIKEYESIKQAIQKRVIDLINTEKNTEKRKTRTEHILLLFDLIVCPYLDAPFKRQMLGLFNINDVKNQNSILQFKNCQKYWFTKWDNLNFAKEIEAKIANEPAY
jgi:hypothetical protein